MKRSLFAIAVACSLAACGGGGSAGSSVVPTGPSQFAQGSGATMPSSVGTIASGYIECETVAQTATGNNCNGNANFANGAFAFTAIAANASGNPIALETPNGAALGFSNGSYTVVESPSDPVAIVSISGGPWSAPGSSFSSGGATYGNRFFVQCVHVGTATLQLQANGVPLPFATSAFAGNAAAVNCTTSFSLTVY